MDQITSQTNGLPDTTNLGSSVSSLMNTLAPILLLSTILSIVLIVAYIFSVIRRYKVEKAILAMQKDIHEMNERQRSSASAAPIAPPVQHQPADVLAEADNTPI